MILIFIYCFVTLSSKNVFISTILDFPVTFDRQFASISYYVLVFAQWTVSGKSDKV
jgi:hypothetical protein